MDGLHPSHGRLFTCETGTLAHGHHPGRATKKPIFCFAINSFCNVGRFDDVVLGFDNMCKLVDGKGNVAIYNIMIHSFVKYKICENGVEFYGRMIKDRVKPVVVTFNILTKGLFRNSKFGLALEVSKEIRVNGCVPDMVTFNTLIKGFFKEGIRMAYGYSKEGQKDKIEVDYNGVAIHLFMKGSLTRFSRTI
ncbi:pentatricopeptide repeat-containing protein [Tanacetum coccineum]